ncbi:MAG: UDP-N-acetylmuramate dehydrogenase [Clostridia bacterium]|nr:UDP-N-acetylmuramate dehydrogenase [Clostridia bacterium]
MRELTERLLAFAEESRVLEDEPMSRHTTFRVGGPADALFLPANGDEIVRAMREARDLGQDCFVMGNGSNLLVRDGGIRGLVIVIGEPMSGVRVEGNILRAQAGAPLTRAAREAASASLKGLAFASGIPGSVGGAVAMNAGAYGGEIKDALARALVLEGEKPVWKTPEELRMTYRDSDALRRGLIVLEAEFRLTPGDREAILAEMNELARRRREKQPLALPSAGSTFKRPEGHFAGALIEAAGLKGLRVGGAQVSELHAGFIVNTGGATARDVQDLIALVQARVLAASGVALEPEVRIIGEE